MKAQSQAESTKQPRCIHCGELLHRDGDRGWVHPEGLIYKQRIEHGEYLDDHAAGSDHY